MQENKEIRTKNDAEGVSDNKTMSAAARRALAEAAARRTALDQNRPVEIDGRGGQDPVRYGDWEVKGLASDF